MPIFPDNFRKLYQTPDTHKPPPILDLPKDVHYPNLNSQDFSARPVNDSLCLQNSWDSISYSDEDVFVFATNRRNGHQWTGAFFGFNQTNKMKLDDAIFKLQCKALISNLRFAGNSNLFVSFTTGEVEAWSTHSEVRDPNQPYCLFQIGHRAEHTRAITRLEVMKANENRAITGCTDGSIKIWDIGQADLFSIQTYRNAHSGAITGIDCSYHDEKIFVTCGGNNNALLWDNREVRPAFGVYLNHTMAFSDICWVNKAMEHLILVGDIKGEVHALDIRQPNKFIKSKQLFDIIAPALLYPKGDNVAVICNKFVKIFNFATDEIVYEDYKATGKQMDAVWRNNKEFITVGKDSKLHVHKMVL